MRKLTSVRATPNEMKVTPMHLHLTRTRVAAIAVAAVALAGMAMIPSAGAAVTAPTLTTPVPIVPPGHAVIVNGTGCTGAAVASVAYITDFGGPLENVVHSDNPISVASDGKFQSSLPSAFTTDIPQGTVLSILGKCGVPSDAVPQSAPITVSIAQVPVLPTSTTTSPASPTTVASRTTTTAPPAAAHAVTAQPGLTG